MASFFGRCELPEVEGPIGMTHNGTIVYAAPGKVCNVPHALVPPLQAETFASARGWVLLRRMGAVESGRQWSTAVSI
jgi:hypothetical protein